jgi:hypothetical protein
LKQRMERQLQSLGQGPFEESAMNGGFALRERTSRQKS